MFGAASSSDVIKRLQILWNPGDLWSPNLLHGVDDNESILVRASRWNSLMRSVSSLWKRDKETNHCGVSSQTTGSYSAFVSIHKEARKIKSINSSSALVVRLLPFRHFTAWVWFLGFFVHLQTPSLTFLIPFVTAHTPGLEGEAREEQLLATVEPQRVWCWFAYLR